MHRLHRLEASATLQRETGNGVLRSQELDTIYSEYAVVG